MSVERIVERMATAIASLEERSSGRRKPKAFYLCRADWADFNTADWPTVDTVWGNNPRQLRTDPAFIGVPVRPSKGATITVSRLYDQYGYGRALPVDPDAPAAPSQLPDMPVEQVFAALDALSRKRALTDRESEALEAAMKGRVILSRREVLRLRVAA